MEHVLKNKLVLIPTTFLDIKYLRPKNIKNIKIR